MPGLQEALHSMTAAGPVPGAGGLAIACPSGAPEVWPRLHEEEKRRADAADGRAERLKREKVQAHREARYWKAQWGQARNALEAARAEAKDLRRVSKDALHLRSEVDRLETLLAAIGVDTRKRSTMASLRIENGRLQAGSEALASGCRRSRASVTACARRLRPCRARSSVARANGATRVRAARRVRTTRGKSAARLAAVLAGESPAGAILSLAP